MKNKLGDIVNVYVDPMTKQELEGKAKLAGYIGGGRLEDGRFYGMWEVEFCLEPGQVYVRTVVEDADDKSVQAN